jgi:arylformamidase
MLYDLSPTIRPGFPVWPGDTAFESRLTWSIAQGASVNLSAVTTTPHLGSHADAPFHTEERGEGISGMPLDRYLGLCRVVKVPPQPLIEPRHLEGVDLASPPRLLFKSESVRDRNRSFPERFTALALETASLLAERGVLLVGMDTPSVDPFDSKTLDAHHALFRGGIAILEGLVLDGVPEGIYELIALPLRIEGLDASPVRAVLRTIAAQEVLPQVE